MDYTPGAMLSMQPEAYRAERPNSASIGTRAYQMALFVIFESGLQMLADNPTLYYRNAMMTAPMRFFCRMSGKKKFTPEDMESMRKTAAFRAADRNAYSWNMDFYPYPDNSGYEARFTACGICTLMRELGLFDLVPAMCALDYAMSDAGGASQFVRDCTLANGDDYCDCGYKKRKIT